MAGSTPELGNCGFQYNCRRGLLCSSGVCLEPCAADATPTQGTCAANYDCYEEYFNGVDLGYGACQPHCDPVSPTTSDATHAACGADQNCEIDFDNKGDTYCLSPAGSLGAGATCAAPTDCKAGYFCTNCGSTGCTMTGTHRCQQYCRIGHSDCTAGMCESFMVPRFDGTQEIGLCSIADAGPG
jgi:hypothetical protein